MEDKFERLNRETREYNARPRNFSPSQKCSSLFSNFEYLNNQTFRYNNNGLERK